MERQRTAWHYFLHLLLAERGPRCFGFFAEWPVTKGLQRLDWLVVRRNDALTPDRGSTLVDLWPLLPRVSILEFKSASKGYRSRELHRLLGYAFQFYSASSEECATHGDLMVVLLVAAQNGALRTDLCELGLRTSTIAEGYWRVEGWAFPMVLVDLAAVAREHQSDLISLFAPDVAPTPEAHQWWYAHYGTKENDMDPRQMEDFKDMERRFIASVSVEDRLAGLRPEDRLAGLRPEEVARAMSESDRVLALPDHTLRVLPETYLATLPSETQQQIRKRLAR